MKRGIFFILLIALPILLLSNVKASIPNDCDSSMVAYWRFNGNANDAYTNHYNGAVSGTVTFTNNKANFNKNGYISVPHSHDLSLVESSGSTIELKFRADEAGTLIKKGNYKIEYDGSKIKATFSGQTVSLDASKSNEHKLALVRDPYSKKLTLYIDSQSASTSLASPTSSSDALIFGEDFKGTLDEIAFYKKALTKSKIDEHLNAMDYCQTPMTTMGKESSTESLFSIIGCKIGDRTIMRGQCSKDGRYFCDAYKGLQNTILEDDACKLNGGMQCCPAGYICRPEKNNHYRCDLREKPCSEYDSRQTCENKKCSWIAGTCVDSPAEYSCSSYKDRVSCNADIWNLGKEGIGTEICGQEIKNNNKDYVVLPNSCKCEWSDIDKKCRLSYKVSSQIYRTPNSFVCLKDYSIDDCKNGLQKIKWTSTQTEKKGEFNPNIDSGLLQKTSCQNGELERKCGMQAIKFPAISRFAILLSVLLITLFYFIKIKNKK